MIIPPVFDFTATYHITLIDQDTEKPTVSMPSGIPGRLPDNSKTASISIVPTEATISRLS